MFAPAVVVHGLPHALTALATGRKVTLISAVGAGRYAGAAWWLALIEAVREATPLVPFDDALDCGDAPGAAMAALRLGQRRLILAPECPAFRAVAGAAATLGAVVEAERPLALDLARPGAAWRLEAWLAG
jgi:hypothetical protein